MSFDAIDEFNSFKFGEIISVFKVEDSDQDYALFYLSDYDDEKADLQVAYLNKDEEGYDYISSIEDKKEFEKVMKVAKDMMEVINSEKQISSRR